MDKKRDISSLELLTDGNSLTGKRSERFWPRLNHSSLIVAGGAAGIASAFNTPLGGIVYAIEELSSHHLVRLRSGLILAVIASGLVSQWILGPYLYFGYPRVAKVAFDILPYGILVGAITGLAGATFGKTLHAVMLW